MHSLKKIKIHIAKKVNKALGDNFIRASLLVYPPNPELGDLSLPCFGLVKNKKQSPAETAASLVGKIKTDKIIKTVKAAGPYINFNVEESYLAGEVIGEIDKKNKKFGENKNGQRKKVMIEYSQPNTHKEYHVGHLRNLCYGDAVNRMLAANGVKAIPVSYVNDFGIHVAKTIWAYKKFFKDKKLPENKGAFLGEVYTRSVAEIEKDPLAKDIVSLVMKKIESRKGEEYKLWEKTRQWSIKQFNEVYEALGVKFFHTFYESEFIDQGREMVAELYAKHFLTKSEGAIIADLDKYDLDALLFIRGDGTTMYPVADLPMAIEKFKRYKLDKSIYVVDVRQSLYFKQLFKVLELLGHKKEIMHLGYEFVKLPEGMMSSRTGNVITYDDLNNQLQAKAETETKKRHQDWPEAKIKKTAAKLARGVIKFEMIKVGADQIINFDINKALRFDGFTAGYLQYTYARNQSIMRKAKDKEEKINFSSLTNKLEHRIIMKLAAYPEAIARAGVGYDPSVIARYLFELAQLNNDYYHQVPVLKANEEERRVRLALLKSVNQIIANGLNLLGIDTVDEM